MDNTPRSLAEARSEAGIVTLLGCLWLSKWPALRLTLHDLPTFMSRKLLVADFSVNDSTLSVGTTGRTNASTRRLVTSGTPPARRSGVRRPAHGTSGVRACRVFELGVFVAPQQASAPAGSRNRWRTAVKAIRCQP